MVAEAILDLNFQRKCSSWASRSQNFACGACNGYVTVRKRFVFVFCGGGPGLPRGRAGAHLPGNQKHSAPLPSPPSRRGRAGRLYRCARSPSPPRRAARLRQGPRAERRAGGGAMPEPNRQPNPRAPPRPHHGEDVRRAALPDGGDAAARGHGGGEEGPIQRLGAAPAAQPGQLVRLLRLPRHHRLSPPPALTPGLVPSCLEAIWRRGGHPP